MLKIDKENFIKVCNESASMASACVKLGMQYRTFRRYAEKFGCYKTNQSGKGMKKVSNKGFTLSDILDGKYPQYTAYKLKRKLIDSGTMKDCCSRCGWGEKVVGQKYSPCELHHKDGNPHNHSLDNIELLCPNCHSLTNTYRSRKREQ